MRPIKRIGGDLTTRPKKGTLVLQTGVIWTSVPATCVRSGGSNFRGMEAVA